MTGSLGDKFPRDEMQEADICVKNYKYKSTSKYG